VVVCTVESMSCVCVESGVEEWPGCLARPWLNIWKWGWLVQVVNAPRGTGAPTAKSEYEVFYMDYGNEEMVPLSRLRPLDPSVSSPAQGLATLCSLAHIRVPELEEDCGEEAAEFLSECVANKPLLMKVEDKDTSGGKVKGKGTGPRSIVTLIDPESSRTIQSLMLEVSLGACRLLGMCFCWECGS
jgi:hypothetical protein